MWVGKCLYKSQKRERHRKKRPHEGGCRDQSDVATNQEIRGTTRAGRDWKDSSLQPLEGGWPYRCLNFGLLITITGREYISDILSHQVCSNFLEQSRKAVHPFSPFHNNLSSFLIILSESVCFLQAIPSQLQILL